MTHNNALFLFPGGIIFCRQNNQGEPPVAQLLGNELLQGELVYLTAISKESLEKLQPFASNARAIRFYQKAGFVPEGNYRNAVLCDGQMSNLAVMSILRREWAEQNG
jgi:hypothetical protein